MKNAVVAITGAGSGIGQALALECAKRGAHIAISDVNPNSLELTRTQVSAVYPNCKLHSQILDVAHSQEVSQWAKNIAQEFGQVNVIINNAGVALAASVEHTEPQDFQWLMNINFWGVIHGCQSFLPYLKQAKWGHVVNVSSIFGIVASPNNSAYHAAKFAVRGFTESLRIEMLMSHKHINVSCVHPGGIKTNIVNNARFGDGVGAMKDAESTKQDFNNIHARTSPQQAAKTIADGIEKKRARILIGLDAKIFDLMQRLFPVGYQKLVCKFFS